MRLFIKKSSHGEEVFFISYANSIRFKINRSNLIYTPYTPKCYMHLIYSLAKKWVTPHALSFLVGSWL
jgi:hypothetical protein